jgi:hypothetical protein
MPVLEQQLKIDTGTMDWHRIDSTPNMATILAGVSSLIESPAQSGRSRDHMQMS